MIIERAWAMPNKNTYSINPIKKFLKENLPDRTVSNREYPVIDPFAGVEGHTFADSTNDLNPEASTDFNLEALVYLQLFPGRSVYGVLFDPPYSPRQVSECYKLFGEAVNMETTQSSYWTKFKKEIARIVRPGGIVISCAWNSGGIGKKYGFEVEKILLVAHGGWHNDTIVTLERKVGGDKWREESR